MIGCHFTGTRGMKREEILDLLTLAKNLKKDYMAGINLAKTLNGKKIVNLFFEDSTRTRLSFELAQKLLGATVANISAERSSVNKGESLYDTLKNIEAMGVDCAVVRYPLSGALAQICNRFRMALVNAGDGMNEHPTQALLDMLTIQDAFGVIEDKEVLVIGDILHSRVARSNFWALKTLGARVSVSGPRVWIPRGIEQWGIDYTENIDLAVEKADVIIALRTQKERQESSDYPTIESYNSNYGINSKRLQKSPSSTILLHPGPVNRGVEITSEVMDGNRSMIHPQVLNGVAVRMAVLKKCLGGLL